MLLKLLKSVILWFKTNSGCGSATIRHSEGRCRNITPQERRYVNIAVRRNISDTPVQITSDIVDATGTWLSERIISRWLNNVSLHIRKLVTYIPLWVHHHMESLHWCIEHIRWNKKQWTRFMICNEFLCTINIISGHQIV